MCSAGGGGARAASATGSNGKKNGTRSATLHVVVYGTGLCTGGSHTAKRNSAVDGQGGNGEALGGPTPRCVSLVVLPTGVEHDDEEEAECSVVDDRVSDSETRTASAFALGLAALNAVFNKRGVCL